VTRAVEPAPGCSDRRDRLLAGLAAVGLLALFVAVQRGRISTYDSKIAVATARAITEGRLHLDPADDGYGWHVPYSHYGIGMPLVILPLHVLQQAFHTPPDVLVTLASPLLLAASAAVLYLSGRELGWSRRLSLAGALVFGTFTMSLQISQDLFSEPGVALATALPILGLLRWRGWSPQRPMACRARDGRRHALPHRLDASARHRSAAGAGVRPVATAPAPAPGVGEPDCADRCCRRLDRLVQHDPGWNSDPTGVRRKLQHTPVAGPARSDDLPWQEPVCSIPSWCWPFLAPSRCGGATEP
jgi:hypothetical protein